MNQVIELTQGMQKEFNMLMLDKELACGSSRSVWSSRVLPNSVVKFEGTAGSFQNIAEWQLWEAVKHAPDIARWLAPCEYISPCGSILIMAKTTKPPKAKYPDQLPAFLTDTKFQNYGMLKGKFVCHDYGSHVAMSHGCTKRTRAAHWWDDDAKGYFDGDAK